MDGAFWTVRASGRMVEAIVTMQGLFKRILIAVLFCALPAQAADAPIRVLALGDSLTQGYGLPPGTDFPTKLQQALKARGLDVTVINAGVSGDTSAGGLARLDWSLGDPQMAPDAAIVELGANDGLRGLPPEEMEKNLDAILAKFKDRHIPVLLAGMKGPRNYGPDYTAKFDAVFPRLAKKYGVLFYPFFLDGVALDPKLIQPDGLHPNPKGVDIIVAKIAPMAAKLVSEAKSRHMAAQSAR
jgi:acyl-CoA thioesterase-1